MEFLTLDSHYLLIQRAFGIILLLICNINNNF